VPDNEPAQQNPKIIYYGCPIIITITDADKPEEK